eukprot:COSAG02_NODE_207_length_29119_cov_41.071365_4_plen_92_part_00
MCADGSCITYSLALSCVLPQARAVGARGAHAARAANWQLLRVLCIAPSHGECHPGWVGFLWSRLNSLINAEHSADRPRRHWFCRTPEGILV